MTIALEQETEEASEQTISTAELAARLSEAGLVVVDTRPLAAYNGWRLEGAARGGHIPGAVAFPRDWLRRVSSDDVSELLEQKGILSASTVVLYGNDPSELRTLLHERGVEVLVYRPGWSEWAADDSLAIEAIPNYEKLVYPEWLFELINGQRPDTYRGGSFVLLHVNFGVPEEYEEGHVPGALYLDTNQLEDSSNIWNRRTPGELEATLLSLGIASDTTVVLYGRDTVGDANEKWPGRRAGQIAATRAAAILRYAGVEDVRLLDGGYDWWVTAGYPLETVLREPVPVESFGVTIPQHPEYIIDLPEAKSILANQEGAALVSVRTWKEHIGR